MLWKDQVLNQLPAEVARFVDAALSAVASEGVCDAPGVVGGVLVRMHLASSLMVRAAAPLTEALVLTALACDNPIEVRC